MPNLLSEEDISWVRDGNKNEQMEKNICSDLLLDTNVLQDGKGSHLPHNMSNSHDKDQLQLLSCAEQAPGETVLFQSIVYERRMQGNPLNCYCI